MKLCVIGGGGVRAVFLAKSLLKNAKNIHVHDIVFMDIDEEKLNIFGTLCKVVANKIAPDVKFRTTTDVVDAVKDADYVITTIRSGGDESRVIDERVALDAGVLGQETTGAGGFAMALRSIPVLIDLCEKVKRYSNKQVLVFNFTNPSGLVTQAMRNAGYDFVYGICDAPSGFQKQLIRLLDTDEERFEMTCFGLNHLSWFKDFKVDGIDVYHKLRHHERVFKDSELRYFDQETIDILGHEMFPNEYLYFYYYRHRAVSSILDSSKTRGETILGINERMIHELKQIDIETNPEKAFDIYMKYYFEREQSYFAIESGTIREMNAEVPTLDAFIAEEDEGGYAAVALNFITSCMTPKPIKMVLSVPNQGAMDFLEDDDVVEISCFISKGVVTPVKIEVTDEAQKNLIRTVKYFERHVAQAIVTKDKGLAIKALLSHPQINSYELAKNLVETYLDKYRAYVGEWH